MYIPCGTQATTTTTTTTSNYGWNTNYGGWNTVVVDYYEPPLILPMIISDGALKSWRIWMGWARALPRYRKAVDASRLRRTRSLLRGKFSISKAVPAGRERGHAVGHSPRRHRS